MKPFLVGVDEVGRGCIFGPVVAAAVILGKYQNFELKDSKKLSEKKRLMLSTDIKKTHLRFLLGKHLQRK